MYENGTHTGISDDQAINRMFELTRNGEIDNSEYALLDAVIQARLRQAYDDGHMDQAPTSAQVAA